MQAIERHEPEETPEAEIVEIHKLDKIETTYLNTPNS